MDSQSADILLVQSMMRDFVGEWLKEQERKIDRKIRQFGLRIMIVYWRVWVHFVYYNQEFSNYYCKKIESPLEIFKLLGKQS